MVAAFTTQNEEREAEVGEGLVKSSIDGTTTTCTHDNCYGGVP